ncbi:MAG: hypothetical protein ACXV8Y_09465 [Acidimicrobiia bacterium]
MAVEEERTPRRDRASLRPGIFDHGTVTTVVLVGLVLLCAGLARWVDNPSTARHGPGCTDVRADDDLLHLPLRPNADRVVDQVERWRACDPRVDDRMQAALERDFALIAGLTVLFGVSIGVVRSRSRPRWRPAGLCAIPLLCLYVVCDVGENITLWRLFDAHPITTKSVAALMPWFAAVKFGAFAGLVPVVLLAVGLSLGRWGRTATPRPSVWERLGVDPSVSTRRHEIRGTLRSIPHIFGGVPSGTAPKAPEVATPQDALGVCASGGGIRSAAFNLGALQSLEHSRRADTTTEIEHAQFLSAVSGGSYIATAWVTARRRRADAWSRMSEEEDYLRRHSSYLAPGMPGKLWAFTRFMFGTIVNFGLVALVVVAVMLPAGWLVGVAHHRETVDQPGPITLPEGGCVQLPSGRAMAVVPGSIVMASSKDIPLDVDAAPLGRARRVPREPDSQSTRIAGRVPTCPAQRRLQPSGALAPVLGTNRVLPARTRVLLAVDDDHRVGVTARRLYGCRSPSSRFTGTRDCVPSAEGVPAARPLESVLVGDGAELVSAPRAVLTLGERVKVNAPTRLGKVCGLHTCRRYVPPWGLFPLTMALLAATALFGIALVLSPEAGMSMATLSRWLRRLTLVSLLVGLVLWLFPWLVTLVQNERWIFADHTNLPTVGGLTLLIAVGAQVVPFAGSGSSAPTSKVVGWIKTLGTKLRPILIRIAAVAIGPLLVLGGAVTAASWASQNGFTPTQLAWLVGILGFLIVPLLGGDLNQWSLHPFYRDRLQSAYAVGPVPDGGLGPRDDDRIADLGTVESGGAQQPTLVICAAANVADDRLTPPGRPVVSWTFEHDCVGSRELKRVCPGTGVATPADLAAIDGTLGSAWTAVAVSGAAFSPAMGKMTRPERFLFALANLRLGVWYPNPLRLQSDEDRAWFARHRFPRPHYLVKEALGIHRPQDRWVYVTDGGHYENLGLVELLRRGCTEIYCFDASGDRPDTFGTIAEAMRLAREQFGVEVTLDPTLMEPPAGKAISPVGVCAGTIRYVGDPPVKGWLVVAKLSVPSTAPFDVVDLARTLPKFPSHPTSDQLYTDQKFEAYRALGHHLGDQAFRLATDIRERVAAGSSLEDAVAGANLAMIASLPEPIRPAAGSPT